MLNFPRLGGPGLRALVTLCAPIVFTIACGGAPSVTTPDHPLMGTTGGSAGSGGSGGTGGSVGIIGVGDQGGQNDNSQGGNGDNMTAVCGDGILEAGELCDDGNTDDGDGCSGDCSMSDPDYLCTEGQACVRVVTCGNGVIEGDEVCDDGNTKSGDGCSAGCDAIEDGYACIKPGEPCVSLPVCGNGVREQGEQCDDGNDKSGDGCSSTCELESGYFCPSGQACMKLKCGDGTRTPDEGCDDGNTKNGDGCSSKCTVETGWLCGTSGCRPICGDGLVLGTEECDDNNNVSGDGCSAACNVEPFYTCTTDQPSVCTSTIVCGNGTLDPGEECDPGIAGEDTCYSTGALACKGYDTGLTDPAVCNNGVVEYGEQCDGAVPGCTNCLIDPGYACPAVNTCLKLPVCGDGVLEAGEECDPGVASTPGCVSCKAQNGYFCSGAPSVCVAIVCGDGKIEPGEVCDDGNTMGGDGCAADCSAVETGYKCGRQGVPCTPDCGDSAIEGTEQCDVGRTPTGTNALACTSCRLNSGYTCGTNGLGPCTATVCGNAATIPTSTAAINTTAYINIAKAQAEPGEGCDDGNTVAGDGCGPTCQLEPHVTVGPSPSVATTCGDGLVTGTETCDDGNTTDHDGCDSNCAVEEGWTCTGAATYPDQIAFRIKYRDFKQRTETGGHPQFKVNGAGNPDGGTAATSPAQGQDAGITGAACTAANTTTCGRLDTDGKPLYVGGTHPTIDTANDGANLDQTYHQHAFKLWYNDTNPPAGATFGAVNDATAQAAGTTSAVLMNPDPAPVPAGGDQLILKKTAATGQPTVKASYRFDSTIAGNPNTFYPLGDASNATAFPPRGFGYTPGFTGTAQRNWQFTSELRYFFQYQGGETLTFFGDDDVWVFINGRLAVDIGGIHGQLNGRVVLGDDGDGTGSTDSDCSIQGANNNSSTTLTACTLQTNEVGGDDKRFALTKGGVYEIVVFQAERHPTGSDYQLTLDGFLAPRSTCKPICGANPDGTVTLTPPEQCDDGSANTATPVYGGCTASTCLLGPYCGDGHPDTGTNPATNLPYEQCDDGKNNATYGGTGCAPGCVTPPYCGDGIVQADHEDCDRGSANSDTAYGGCTTQCKLGPYCGDGNVTNGELCDTPGAFATYGQGKCNFNCQPAPYCGDGIRNGNEICDGTPGCTADCQLSPYCGDGIKEDGEQCDFGKFGFDGAAKDAPYDGCTTTCLSGPYCGDSTVQANDGEECDNGSKNSDTAYNGCTTSCLLGPRCGDAIVQKGAGETCDNGFNDDDYAYPGDADPCGPNCKAVPYCGDGKVQSAFELCDNGSKNSDTAYNGCTTSCEWGPYCGDGTKNGPEQCDNGVNNTAYSADGTGCSYDCMSDVPYCGDGVRNGPEQCDDGSDDNTGAYGGCNSDCTKAAYCGDGVVQRDDGEQCDDGPTGSLTCTSSCKLREITK